MSPTRIEVRNTRQFKNTRPIYDLFADGRFIVGAASVDALALKQKTLEKNSWQFLSLTEYGDESPIAFIKRVRAVEWSFDSASTITVGPDRSFFSGSVDDRLIEFKFLILDSAVIDQIRALAPEVYVRDFRREEALAT